MIVGVDEGVPPLERKPPAASGYPRRSAAWATCAILTLGCVLAFADRGILSLFILPLRRDLRLDDTQVSLLVGFAFSVFNAIFGLPLGRLVDVGRRRTIAAAGIFVWSVAASLCGIVGSFSQLFVARIGVGAGEAAVTPAAVSLLADSFPPARRGLPMGIFYGGMFLGSGGVLLLGGILWRLVGDRIVEIPILGALHSWQAILIGLGAAGLVVGPLTLLIREPARRQIGRSGGSGARWRDIVVEYQRHPRALFGHNLGFCLQNFTVHAGSAWLPVVLVRSHGWSLSRAGLTFGLMLTVLGPLGSISAGLLADRRRRRGHADAKIAVAIFGSLACAAGSAAIGLGTTSGAVTAGLLLYAFFAAFSLPLGPGVLQDVMPNELRGQAVAIYVFLINVVAGSLAPLAVALLTQDVFGDPAATGCSFAIVAVAASMAACTVLGWSRAPLRRAISARDEAAHGPRPIRTG